MGADVGGARLESIAIFIQLCLPETGKDRRGGGVLVVVQQGGCLRELDAALV